VIVPFTVAAARRALLGHRPEAADAPDAAEVLTDVYVSY